MSKKLEDGIYYDLTNDEYHEQQDIEDHYFSSSQLKDMLGDPETFHQKYVLRDCEKYSSAAMDIGTCYHTEILEPHLAEDEYTVWDGGRKGTKLYKEFEAENQGKIILTKADKIKLDRLVQVTQNSPMAMNLLEHKDAQKEVSFLITVFGVQMKVRTDILILGKDYSCIADPKSTTGNVKDKIKMRRKVADSNYELSAAMYIVLVNECIRQFDLPYAPVTDFFWIFASKDPTGNCKVWRASEDQIKVGMGKFMTAVTDLKKYMDSDWSFEDSIDDLEPMSWDKTEWIKEEDSDDEDELTDML